MAVDADHGADVGYATGEGEFDFDVAEAVAEIPGVFVVCGPEDGVDDVKYVLEDDAGD